MNSYTTHMKDPVVQNTQNPNITTTSFFGQQPNFRTISSSHNGQDDRHHFDPCFSNYNETDEKVVVQHNCREDHSMVPNDKRQEICTKGGVKIPFPVKLFNMLEHIDLQEPHLSSIISWQPNGRCFLTHDTKKLEELVLPKFFKQKQYASFRRQLNLWGFKRLTQNGPDNGAYYHELFLRSKTFLCRGITRTAPGGRRGVSSTRAPSNPEAEPKFYSMVSLPPSTILASALASASDINANTMGGATQDATLASSTTMLANGTIEGLVSDYSSSPCLEPVQPLPLDDFKNQFLAVDVISSQSPKSALSGCDFSRVFDSSAFLPPDLVLDQMRANVISRYRLLDGVYETNIGTKPHDMLEQHRPQGLSVYLKNGTQHGNHLGRAIQQHSMEVPQQDLSPWRNFAMLKQSYYNSEGDTSTNDLVPVTETAASSLSNTEKLLLFEILQE